MKRIKEFEIDTKFGQKQFELYQGDITNFVHHIDLLAVSVKSGIYQIVPGSLIGTLYENFDLDIQDLLENCEFDLRNTFSCWVSKEIPYSYIGRILCVEFFSSDFSIKEIIENVFVMLSILEKKGIEIKNFALPLLGTGVLSIKPDLIIELLLDYSLKHLSHSHTLQAIIFVAHEDEDALQLSEAMTETITREIQQQKLSGLTLTNLRNHVYQIECQNTVKFLNEAISCFENEAYRASVVLSWIGAISLLQTYVYNNHLTKFNEKAKERDGKWKEAKNTDDLGKMKEFEFLNTLESLSIIGKNVKQQLQNQLQLRNACGHPNSFELSTNTVASHLEVLILNVFSNPKFIDSI